MNTVHELNKKPWISRRRINLKQLVEERESQLCSKNIDLNQPRNCTNEDDRQLVGNERELLEEMDKFITSNETQVKPYFLFNNSISERTLIDVTDNKWKMCELQYEHAKKMLSPDRTYKVSYLMKLHSTRRELLMRQLATTNRQTVELLESVGQEDDKPLCEESHEMETNDQLTGRSAAIIPIVVVQIWPQPTKLSKIHLEKEILFRGDQCLTELRNQFKCQRDYGVPIDLSDNPEQAERVFRGELFKSGFFLIEDTFYNDMRDQSNIDLSANIVHWASRDVVIVGEDGRNLRTNRGIGPFKRVGMEEHKFEDLVFRLGCPYLYLHQGDCEHLFTISDIRYVPNDDKLRETKFPYVTATSIGRKLDNLKCYMCRTRPPHWYTRNNSRLPVDPYFFCDDCFYSFNYDKNKRKLGQFQAYLYTSAVDIPDNVIMATTSGA